MSAKRPPPDSPPTAALPALAWAPIAALSLAGAVLPAQAAAVGPGTVDARAAQPLDVLAERLALRARVDAVRALLNMPTGAVVSPSAQPAPVAQAATNWTNWPKWSKWSNWANK